jgi:hypothetical protein
MKKKKAIENILDNFNFESVHKAMTVLNWTWYFTDGVPKISDLRKEARRLLKDVAKRKEDKFFTGTGGFEVSKEDGILELKFVIAEWDETYKKKKK